MPRDAEATRTRIRQAAIAEFSAVGLAGGRVDRIAAASGVDKKMIYNYFGDKETLFARALDSVIGDLLTQVPIDEDDLPGYAAGLFDYLLAHPQALRLTLWRQLERPTLGPEATDIYSGKITAAVTAARGAGGAAPVSPTDLLVLVQGMACAWMISPLDLLTADGSDPTSGKRIAAHRAALVVAVERLVAPPPAPR